MNTTKALLIGVLASLALTLLASLAKADNQSIEDFCAARADMCDTYTALQNMAEFEKSAFLGGKLLWTWNHGASVNDKTAINRRGKK
jgi:hypothetical protein